MTMTITEIAQSFPERHNWNHEQQQTVINAINAIIGQTFICNHPNMLGVETTVVQPDPRSSGSTLYLHSPSNRDFQHHECDVFHFAEFYTPKQQEPVVTTMTFDVFATQFASTDNLVNFILNAHEEGNVETIEYTIPHYTYIPQENRFVAHSDDMSETHHYEVTINMVATNEVYKVLFRRGCYNDMELFMKHLSNRLSDSYGGFETEEMNITDPREMERTALSLQFGLNTQRMNKARMDIIERGSQMGSQQFIQSCRDLANLADENKATKERLEQLI